MSIGGHASRRDIAYGGEDGEVPLLGFVGGGAGHRDRGVRGLATVALDELLLI